ncbi:flavonol 7-O-beta-glucosyltransferase UGT74F1-like [Aristolochia californica]|uniref:flavonol 7-O-beta-glucosyltransferase UGT74F1-like n=1 Tax=Aristolochia californica TaxID=171875 RepID=UPI0035E35CFE
MTDYYMIDLVKCCYFNMLLKIIHQANQTSQRSPTYAYKSETLLTLHDCAQKPEFRGRKMVSAKVFEKKEKLVSVAHVLVLPFPVQGHINPMLQFAKRLASKGVKVTLATTIFISKHVHVDFCSVVFDTISDGYDQGGFFEACSPKAYHHRFEVVGSQTLAELIEKQESSAYPFTCLVYDTSLHWALDVAKTFGLQAVAFSTQSCAAFIIYYYVYLRRLMLPAPGSTISVPGLPPLAVHELPSLLFEVGSYQPILAMKLKQFSNLHKADCVLFNSVEELEAEVLNCMRGVWRIKTVGPAMPTMYLHKCVAGDKDYGLNYYKPSGVNYMEWLDTKPLGSVVYVSFGSIATVGAKQMEEFAWGLRDTGKHFLWVVRASEEAKLPKEFKEERRDKGLVVTWCCQMEVLAHKAVGCFVTHCGWNSILEALTLGVPMLGVPLWTDQPINAKYVEDVWEVGLRARVDKNGIVTREEMKLRVKEAIQGKRGKDIKNRACKWRKLIQEAASEGGSSNSNMEEFVKELVNVNWSSFK